MLLRLRYLQRGKRTQMFLSAYNTLHNSWCQANTKVARNSLSLFCLQSSRINTTQNNELTAEVTFPNLIPHSLPPPFCSISHKIHWSLHSYIICDCNYQYNYYFFINLYQALLLCECSKQWCAFLCIFVTQNIVAANIFLRKINTFTRTIDLLYHC